LLRVSLLDLFEDNADAPFVLIAHLVVQNEADRYLTDCLSALIPMVDHIHVFDDQSTDSTPLIAEALGAQVQVRPTGVPSFRQHEGEFRQAAWESMGTLPDESWVVCVDADEFLTSDPRPVATGANKLLKVHEVFDVQDDQPMVRVDGFWGSITAARIAAWTAKAEFPDMRLGCGSLPLAIADGDFELVDEPQVLHYGYTRPTDRQMKYARYVGRRGHNERHVRSILRRGTLRPFGVHES
jgi:hypothetical protein